MPEVSYQQTEEWMENRNVAPCHLYLPHPHQPTPTSAAVVRGTFIALTTVALCLSLLQLAQSALLSVLIMCVSMNRRFSSNNQCINLL